MRFLKHWLHISGAFMLALSGLACLWFGYDIRSVEPSEMMITWRLALLLIALAGALWLSVQAAAALDEFQKLDKMRSDAYAAGLVVSGLLITGFWYGLALDGFKAWAFRSGLSLGVSSVGTMLWAVCLFRSPYVWVGLRRTAVYLPHLPMAVPIVAWVCGAALFVLFALDGLPHMHDATIYRLQASLLASGTLSAQEPDSAFLANSLLLSSGPHGLYGKYPLGWPLVLAIFGLIKGEWIANVCVSAAIAVVAYSLICRLSDIRTAGVALFIVLFSVWPVLTASDQLSHHISSLWLLWFYYGYDRAFFNDHGEVGVHGSAQLLFAGLAGLSLGAAILTRPFDAAIFAFPVVIHAIWQWKREGIHRLLKLLPVAVPPLLAVIGQLELNRYFNGGALIPTYGQDSYIDSVMFMVRQNVDSIWDYPIWFHQSLSAMNFFWFGGSFGGLGFAAVGLLRNRLSLKRAGLYLACCSGLLIGYGVTVFTSTTWFGPRWYIPLIPATAFLIARGVKAAIDDSDTVGNAPAGRVGRFYVALLLAAVTAAWTVMLPRLFHDLRAVPPHGVSKRLLSEISRAHLSNAVVLLPRDGYTDNGVPHFKLHRNAEWTLNFPLNQNSVIYLIDQPGHEEEFCALFPSRKIFRMNNIVDDFRIRPVPCPTDTLPNPLNAP